MIHITSSDTADPQTSEFDPSAMRASTVRHIADVAAGLAFFGERLQEAGRVHDADKLTDLDAFRDHIVHHRGDWFARHRRLNRHHLTHADGIPADVNLIDVLDHIADCVMAGLARSGAVSPLSLPPDVLARAFQNTVTLLQAHVVVDDD